MAEQRVFEINQVMVCEGLRIGENILGSLDRPEHEASAPQDSQPFGPRLFGKNLVKDLYQFPAVLSYVCDV